jgi:uncharacterized membrane protein
MIPSLVGSAVDVRQTAGTISVVHITEDIYICILSVLPRVMMARRSYWVPLLVTVRFRVTAAHEPGAPHAAGGV